MQVIGADDLISALRKAEGAEQNKMLKDLTHQEKNAVILRLLERQKVLSRVIPALVDQVDVAVATVERMTEKL